MDSTGSTVEEPDWKRLLQHQINRAKHCNYSIYTIPISSKKTNFQHPSSGSKKNYSDKFLGKFNTYFIVVVSYVTSAEFKFYFCIYIYCFPCIYIYLE